MPWARMVDSTEVHAAIAIDCGILDRACEFTEQAKAEQRAGFRAHDQPPVGLPALPDQLEAAGVETISSQALAEQFHLNAAQIRKDLAYFGEFGVRGVGYYVKDLKRHLRQILGLDRKLRVAVMGAGNLGLALADYPGFRREGFEIVALFDVADAKIGDESRSGVPISRHPRAEADRAEGSHRYRRHRRARRVGAAGARSGRGGRRQGV